MRYTYARDTPSAKDTLMLEIRLRLKKGLRPSWQPKGGLY